MIYQKKTLWYYINPLFVQFWNIAVLLGHLILLSITDIEKIQRRATKLVKSATNLPYCDRLKKLVLTTLYYRRLRADVRWHSVKTPNADYCYFHMDILYVDIYKFVTCSMNILLL